MSYKQTLLPLCLHRIESGKHRKFGLYDLLDELDLDLRTLLTKLVKKRTLLPKEYTLQYFDGMLDTQFECLVEPAVPGYRLLAYEVTNEWWDTSKGRFWVNNAMNLVQFQQEDGASFMKPEPNVGNTGAVCVFFERPTLKNYKIQIDTW